MQIFPRSSNAIARASLFVAVFAVAGLFWVVAQLQRSPYITQAGVRKPQPVPFSHQHHVTGLGIDCRYCHTSVEAVELRGHSSDQDLHELSCPDLDERRLPRAGA